jgi:hypothetical protein
MPKREIARVARGGAPRTDSAVLKTLKANRAISDGLRVQTNLGAGKGGGGSARLYCVLNQQAAQAFRRKDKELAIRYAKAAARIEGKAPTKKLAKLITERKVDVRAASLAKVFAGPEMVDLTRAVSKLIADEERKIKGEPIHRFSGRVAELSGDDAVIKLEGTGKRMSIPRVLLDEEGLSSNGRAVSARWEMTGDGMMLVVIEPMVDDTPEQDPTTSSEPLVDVYGTARGKILAADDGAFVMQMLGTASMALDKTGSSGRPVRSRRRLIPIEG